jgi:hemolysin activation/secretion protein
VKFGSVVAYCVALPITFVALTDAKAQSIPSLPFGIGNAVQQGEQSRQAAPAPGTPAALVLPGLVEPQFTLKDKETLFVRRFAVEQPDLIDPAEVQTTLVPYQNRKLTLAEIYQAAGQITTLYRTHGYLLATAYVPAQDARAGVLRIKVIVGRYGAIAIKNNSLVRDDFLQAVINRQLGDAPYIQQSQLERAMLNIYDIPGAGMPRAAIAAGQQPGATDFSFGVPEARRVDGYLLADNFGAPYFGRDRVSGGINLNSPLGIGDRFSAFGVMTEDGGIKDGRIDYAFPIGFDSTRADVGAYHANYVLGGTFAALNATGTADAVTGTLTYALLRSRAESIYFSANYTHKDLNDSALGISYAERTLDSVTGAVANDTAGAIFGMLLVTHARFSLTSGNVAYPDPAQLALNMAGPDSAGEFQKINGTFRSTLGLTDTLSLLTEVEAQKTLSGNLDTSEQMLLTGFFGVRSFDDGLAGDSGYLVRPELRYALPDVFAWRHSVGAFTDVGGVWLANPDYTTIQKPFTQLSDVGLGYYGTYEYLPNRFVLLKAMVVHTYGSDAGAQTYNEGTRGLVQAGFTF